MNETVVCFYIEIGTNQSWKYEGELLYDTDETYIIHDFVKGKVRVPKQRCCLVYKEEKFSEEKDDNFRRWE